MTQTSLRLDEDTQRRLKEFQKGKDSLGTTLNKILDKVLMYEKIIQPEKNLTPLDESNETIYPISPDFKEESNNDHEEIENRLIMVENDIIAINKDRTRIENVLNIIISRLKM